MVPTAAKRGNLSKLLKEQCKSRLGSSARVRAVDEYHVAWTPPPFKLKVAREPPRCQWLLSVDPVVNARQLRPLLARSVAAKVLCPNHLGSWSTATGLPPSRMARITSDCGACCRAARSVLVTVENCTPLPLHLADFKAGYGMFRTDPPAVIPAGRPDAPGNPPPPRGGHLSTVLPLPFLPETMPLLACSQPSRCGRPSRPAPAPKPG